MKKELLLSYIGNLRKSNSGNVTVEFALVLPLLLLLGLPVIDFSVVIFNKINLRTAINTGVVSGMELTSVMDNVKSTIEGSTSISNLTLTVTEFCQCSDNTVVACGGSCGGSVPDKYFQITANATVDLYMSYGFLTNPFPISETAIVMVP